MDVAGEAVQQKPAVGAVDLTQALQDHWDDDVVWDWGGFADVRAGLNAPIGLVEKVCAQKRAGRDVDQAMRVAQ